VEQVENGDNKTVQVNERDDIEIHCEARNTENVRNKYVMIKYINFMKLKKNFFRT
jgi:hypothetical protein